MHTQSTFFPVAVVGGGLGGLVSAILLKRAGFGVILFEKYQYPFHRVCGEYISNEVQPILEDVLETSLKNLGVSSIQTLQVTESKGNIIQHPLDLGGFGISRFALDHLLYQKALEAGVVIRTQTEVESIEKIGEEAHWIYTKQGEVFQSKLVIGAFGKRSKLDQSLHRKHLKERSGYMGVKYHIRHDFPKNVIALHNFPGGYCGMSAIEEDVYCLCYLIDREVVRSAGGIDQVEKKYLAQNPYLADIFQKAEFLNAKPWVINEISFAPKKVIEDGILMVGDSAGLITPLCGNGMSMAIRAAVWISIWGKTFLEGSISRQHLEEGYARSWRREFSGRLWVGRQIQGFFGKKWLTYLGLKALQPFPKWRSKLIRATHGEPISLTEFA